MGKPFFRSQSLKSITHPDELHDYMRVTSPRLWMMLSVIVALLLGFIIFASTVTMESLYPVRITLQTLATTEEHREATGREQETLAYSVLPASRMNTLSIGMPVRVGEEHGAISYIGTVGDDEINVLYDMEHAYIPLPDGEYDANIVMESITPFSLLFN